MNKTTEALKLAEEALVKANHFHDYEDALAAIREALAEPVKQDTPYCKCAPMCAKPCGDESCVEPVKQEEAKLPVEPVAWNIKRNRPAYCSDDPTEVVALLTVNPEPIGRLLNDGTLMTYPGKMVHLGDDLYAAPVEPVKQEPVAWYGKSKTGDILLSVNCVYEDWQPLYAAPVQPVNTRSCSEYSEVEYSEPVKSAIMTKQQIEELSKKMWDELQHIAFEENTPKYWTYVVNNTWRNIDEQQPPEDAYDEGTLEPLYAAPVDAKAILEMRDKAFQSYVDQAKADRDLSVLQARLKALEEAAKVCDDESRYSNDAECCAAAIRGMK